MRPTLRQMEYLVAIADTGSFSDAAKKCFVSQPSLSAQVKDMELDLGATLLERGRSGAILTPKGKVVTQRARLILSEVRALRSMVLSEGGQITGRFRLGVLPTVGPYLLPQALHRLHALFPDLRIDVREGAGRTLDDDLRDGKVDFILSLPDYHADLPQFKIVSERLYICMAPDDPLANETGPIHSTKLKGRDILSLGYAHRLSQQIISIGDAVGAQVKGEYEGTSLDAVRQMASMGDSLAILPSLYAISEAKRDPDLRVRPLIHKGAGRHIALIWRAGSPLAEEFERIGTTFREVAENVMAAGGSMAPME